MSVKALDGQKNFRFLLNHERGAYQLAGPDVNKPPKPNGSLSRLTAPKKGYGDGYHCSFGGDEETRGAYDFCEGISIFLGLAFRGFT